MPSVEISSHGNKDGKEGITLEAHAETTERLAALIRAAVEAAYQLATGKAFEPDDEPCEWAKDWDDEPTSDPAPELTPIERINAGQTEAWTKGGKMVKTLHLDPTSTAIPFVIRGYRQEPDGAWYASSWIENGSFFTDKTPSNQDLTFTRPRFAHDHD